MKCLYKYKWVKLLRSRLPEGKGVMGDWAALASRVAFRKGQAMYCGHVNEVCAGSWVGGIIGVKSILGLKKKSDAFFVLDKLQGLGYIDYEYESDTRKLSYHIKDWVFECSGTECMDDNVYATNDYGFLCVPRDITERLVERGYVFEEADAWLDLWTHTIYEDEKNFYSFFAPMIRISKISSFLSLETLGNRWGWEKTKTWRFFQKYKEVFKLQRLPGSYGCLIFNSLYPTNKSFQLPTDAEVIQVIDTVRELSDKMNFDCANDKLHSMIEFFSPILAERKRKLEREENTERRVAVFTGIIRAYFSPCWCCKNCDYDCKGICNFYSKLVGIDNIRGPCESSDTQRSRRIFMSKKSDTTKERSISFETEAMLKLFTRTGLIGDARIDDKKIREAKQKKQKNAYHNTELLLRQYRNIAWIVECFPEQIAEELEEPFEDVDELIERLDVKMAYGNKRIENRLEGLQKTRLILDKVNDALTVLKKKPEVGERLYELIYLTYIAPEKLSHVELLFRLNVSTRHYYRLREQAFNIISIRLWSAPQKDIDFWLEMLTILDEQ